MSRTDDDSRTIEKVKRIIERLPGFASRYFNHNMDLKAPRSLYGYALDLASFFQYLEGTGYDIKKMTMQNLERVTPQVIEDYMECCRTHMKGHHTKKEMSLTYPQFPLYETFYRVSLNLILSIQNDSFCHPNRKTKIK